MGITAFQMRWFAMELLLRRLVRSEGPSSRREPERPRPYSLCCVIAVSSVCFRISENLIHSRAIPSQRNGETHAHCFDQKSCPRFERSDRRDEFVQAQEIQLPDRQDYPRD